MKYKILLILVIGTIITTGIYFNLDHSKKNLLALGDGISLGMTPYQVEGYDFNDYLVDYLQKENKLNHYFRYFNETDETATSLNNKIDNNISNRENQKRIKQAIKQADIITIALGMDELNNYASKNYLGSTKIRGFLNKYEEVLAKIRKLNDKYIYVIGLYDTNQINSTKITKINNELKRICQKNKIYFIDISDIKNNSEYFPLTNSYYFNYRGHQEIFQKIKEKLEKAVFTLAK